MSAFDLHDFTILGLTRADLLMVAIVVFLIFGWSWVPRIFERIGALLGRERLHPPSIAPGPLRPAPPPQEPGP